MFSVDFKQQMYQEKTIYSKEQGFGFVKKSGGYQPREFAVDKITYDTKGCRICLDEADIWWTNPNHYHYNGMVFRVDLQTTGTYEIEVTIHQETERPLISVNDQSAQRLLGDETWDAAQLIHKSYPASWNDRTWHYAFVAGHSFIEIEIEPQLITEQKPEIFEVHVGMESIRISPIMKSTLELDSEQTFEPTKPTLFILGDSTVKSYIFEEAGMSGWGQVMGPLFDLGRINVINYSMGGRSFKSMYQEGRLNDLLLSGKEGDFVIVQSGHNDESTGEEMGPSARFGRGSTPDSYVYWMSQIFIPSIKARNMIPVFVTPMTRVDCDDTEHEHVVFNGFSLSDDPSIDFPGLMKQEATKHGLPLIDLYHLSFVYLNQIGKEAAHSMYLSLEAGEVPSKTNSGSYANGNPYDRCDGTHFKESLSKQFARLIVSELFQVEPILESYLADGVKEAVRTSDWSKIYPECVEDILHGENAKYRNQIEKLLQMHIMSVEQDGKFQPKKLMSIKAFIDGLCKIWTLEPSLFTEFECETMTREKMAVMVYIGYKEHFGIDQLGNLNRTKYMTDYNGTNLPFDHPHYDPNLKGDSGQYYPLTPWEHIEDRKKISEDCYKTVKEAYHLGLIRCETNSRRGRYENGTCLDPQLEITKEMAAKCLYFLWVHGHDILEENHCF